MIRLMETAELADVSFVALAPLQGHRTSFREIVGKKVIGDWLLRVISVP